jgi:hypothetical protein
VGGVCENNNVIHFKRSDGYEYRNEKGRLVYIKGVDNTERFWEYHSDGYTVREKTSKGERLLYEFKHGCFHFFPDLPSRENSRGVERCYEY